MLLNCGVGEDSCEVLDCKEIKPVNPKENQSWIFIGRTDVEAEAAILWPLDAKNWLIRKDPDAGKDWMQEEKGTIEDELIGWHHWLNGHEFEQAPGVGDGQGSLVCCSPWGCKRAGHNWVTELKEKTSHSVPRLPTCRNNYVIYNTDELINISCISAIPNCFGIRDWFCGRQFFHNRGGEGWEDGMVSGYSNTLHLSCTLFLLLLHCDI